MPVPFGVSVGDFIAGIEFLYSIKEALEESAGSRAQYQGVLSTLQSSQQALERLNTFAGTLGDEDRDAVNDIVERYKRTTAVLASKIQRFENALGKGAPDAWWKALPKKVTKIHTDLAFLYVLADNFKDMPGLLRVKGGFFRLQDVHDPRKNLLLSRLFKSVFRPGRRVQMSVMFGCDEVVKDDCPKCGRPETIGKSFQVQC
ncbi:hypothetical protein LTR85_000908 [Meristemomyces frigidus]|nr:hypothetical protein LTR85_000908 [Meristemomyces frigidus]